MCIDSFLLVSIYTESVQIRDECEGRRANFAKIMFGDLNLTFRPTEFIAKLSSNAVSLQGTRPKRWNGTYRAKGKDRTYLRGGTRWKAFYRLTYIVNCLKRRPGALRTNLNSEPSRYIDTCKLGKTPDHYSVENN